MAKRKYPIEKLAKRIKLLILDVDGVMTDNCLYLNDRGIESKKFNILDGMGIWLAQKAGIEVALISGRPSKATEFRALHLKIKHVYLGELDKIRAYQKLKRNLNVKDDEIAYMGDDILDVPVLKRVGLPICVKNANPKVKKFAKLVTETKGGEGAVREVVDIILKAKKKDTLEWVL
ncbi:MAG: HAD hydrolase family protein [candidate division Zixibacteria bacterium]|nr:HAD hydrolase family protein [candidate division Zixibacteria bacterium]